MDQYTSSNYQYAQQPPISPKPQKEKGGLFVKIIAILLGILMVANIAFMVLIYFFPKSNVKTAQEIMEEERNLNQYLEEVADECLSLNNLALEEGDYDDLYITGSLENDSDEDLEDIEIFVNCYDDNGNYIDYDYIYITKLEAGETYDINNYLYTDSEIIEEIKVDYVRAYYSKDLH